MVALTVFGKGIGVQRQSQIALLILLACIVLEILGEPFREVTKAHAILKRLELSALLVEWFTLWCGLMIHQSGPNSKGTIEFMTMFVILVNVLLTLWFVTVLVRAFIEENQDSTCISRLASWSMYFRCSARTEAGSGKNELEDGKDAEEIVWYNRERDHVELKMRTFESPGSSSFANPLANLTGSAMKTVELELAKTTHHPKQ